MARSSIQRPVVGARKTEKGKAALKWLKRIAVFVGLPSVLVSPIVSAYSSPKIARLLSHRHVIKGIWTEFQPARVSCTAWNMTLIPKQSITHLDLFIRFAQEYHDVLIRPVRPDFSGRKFRQIPGDVAIKEPCDFDEASTANSANFSVIQYSNRTDIRIKASDLLPEDTYTVVVLFHPDFMIGTTGWGGKIVNATYTAYGQELAAVVDMQSPPPSFGPMSEDDLPEIPSELDKH